MTPLLISRLFCFEEMDAAVVSVTLCPLVLGVFKMEYKMRCVIAGWRHLVAYMVLVKRLLLFVVNMN